MWHCPLSISPGRVSIRESLRIFALIEEHLSTQKSAGYKFEELVAHHSATKVALPSRSCGATNSAFASLFFSRKQLSNNAVQLHTNGSSFEELWNNMNIVFWSMRTKIQITRRSDVQHYMAGVFSASAERHVVALRCSLFREDTDAELPRVVFCNCSWVLYDSPASDGEDDTGIKDHQFCLIKHAADRYQLVQGYISSKDGNHSDSPLSHSSKSEHADGLQGGYYLSEWQNQISIQKVNGVASDCLHGRRFAASSGFSATEMLSFLGSFASFAAPNQRFDAGSFKQLFGVFEASSSGRRIYPAVSFRELEDSAIDGFGERVLADRIGLALALTEQPVIDRG